MNFIKFIRIFLLVLIIVGIGLLTTQKIWVPKVVDVILKNEITPKIISNEINVLNLPATCKDEQEGMPVITSLSSYSGSIGTKLEINGCNFSGFESDIIAIIKNKDGIIGILPTDAGSTSKFIKTRLESPLCQKNNSYSGAPCDATLNLVPGLYKIYTSPWGKQSNEVNFTIK